MGQFDISKLIAYAVAMVTMGFGLAMITNWLNLELEPNVRYLFGFVLVLMGIYRLVMTRIKTTTTKRRRIIDDEE